MKLYGHPGSPFVRKALVALEEKGIPYELEILVSVPPKGPELLALHPLGKIPVLRDADVDTRMFEVLGGILFERVVKPYALQQENDEARVADLLEREVPPVLDYLETQLPAEGDSVLARFGIADAALGGQLGSLTLAGIEIDAGRWPCCARCHPALLARPSFEKAMAR